MQSDGYRGRRGFTRVVVVAFAAMDASFKALVVPAYVDLTGGRTARGGSRLGLCVETAAVLVVTWLAAVLALCRTVERWRASAPGDGPGEGAIRGAVLALGRFPLRMAMAWSCQWLLLFAIVTVRAGASSQGAVVFFLAAMALGPLPLAYGLAAWLVSPVVRGAAMAARRRGLAVPTPRLTLRWQLAFHSLCICMAPTFYMTAVAFAVRAQPIPVAHLLTTVLIFFGGIALFAVLCAALLASTITGPVAAMAEVLRAITRQGDVARVGRVPLYRSDEVGALGDVINQMIDRLELAEGAQAQAAGSLAALNRTLEGRVDERTAALTARTADMRLVLDNVEQGLFTVDRSGALSSEHSAILATWFGALTPGEPLHRYLGRTGAPFGAALEVAWQQIVDDFLPVEVAVAQLPERLAHAGRHYRFRYDRVGTGEAVRFMVVVSDVTREIEREAIEREKRESLALFEHLLADRNGLCCFVEEGAEIVARLVAERAGEAGALKRDLHTLKGNAALFGLASVAELCHEMESRLVEEQAGPDDSARARLDELWRRRVEPIDRLLDERRLGVELSADQHAALERAVHAGAAREQLLRMVRELKLEPVERPLRRFAEQAARIGKRLDKRVRLHISHDDLRLDGKSWAPFWAAFVHAVRNAVDHGIESPAERRAAGKPEEGQIKLRAARRGTAVVIEIEDDGRGVAWDELRRRLETQGVKAGTRHELVAALLSTGVSTARETTDLSGRGIGMGALGAAVEELGGLLEIESEAGRGTCLRMTFAEAAIAPDLAAPSLPPSSWPS